MSPFSHKWTTDHGFFGFNPSAAFWVKMSSLNTCWWLGQRHCRLHETHVPRALLHADLFCKSMGERVQGTWRQNSPWPFGKPCSVKPQQVQGLLQVVHTFVHHCAPTVSEIWCEIMHLEPIRRRVASAVRIASPYDTGYGCRIRKEDWTPDCCTELYPTPPPPVFFFPLGSSWVMALPRQCSDLHSSCLSLPQCGD